MRQAWPSSLSWVLFAQWCIKEHQRVKPQIKQFEVPHNVGGSWKTSRHVPGHVFGCLVCGGYRAVGLSPIKGSSHKTENYVQISTLPPHLCAGSWPQPTRAHTISQHYCLLSQNSLPPPRSPPALFTSIMFQSLRIYTCVRIMDNGQDAKCEWGLHQG